MVYLSRDLPSIDELKTFNPEQISKILNDGFQVVIIPQTLKLTNLVHLKKKSVVNIEFDVLGKYIKSFLK